MTPNRAGSEQLPSDGVKPSPKEAGNGGEIAPDSNEDPSKSKSTDENTSKTSPVNDEKATIETPASPQVQSLQYHHAYLPHLTPQSGGGYYLYGNPQVTPEPPSPATPGYDMNSFLQQQAALGLHHGNPFGSAGQYGGIPQPPLSPGRNGMVSGLIPPPSPLFPRAAVSGVGSFDQHSQLDSSVFQRIQGQSSSPSMSYMPSPSLGPSNGGGFGPGYAGYASAGSYAGALSGGNGPAPAGETSGSQNEGGWGVDGANFQQYPPSPRQGQPGGYAGMSRAGNNNRSYSFDEMLPPSVLDPQDPGNAPYSPYSSNPGISGNTLFAQQSWGYSPTPDMYNPPQSPLQTRQSPHMQFPVGHPGMGPPPMHQMGPYGGAGPMPPYYPATSPGPPIQTTASNKGPDGANLFIFHIPNHFTNLDMYRLFCQYGNLLSVRIMVEKDTGRSRGFGFVSYDSPESAALAIKELNGFAIGNKRLKVQHKQIRGDQSLSSFGTSPPSGDPSFMPRPMSHHTDHMGLTSTMPWYDSQQTVPGDHGQEGQQNESESTTHEKGDISGLGETTSPLGTLEPLRVALPDVGGHPGTAE